MSDCGADLQTDLSSASKVFTTWTEFHVLTDQLPNIVPWCYVAHTGPQWLHRQGFHFGALPWSFHLSPNHPLFSVLEKNADWVNRGMLDCMTASETIRSRSYVFLCATFLSEASKGLHRQTLCWVLSDRCVTPVCWHLLELAFTCFKISPLGSIKQLFIFLLFYHALNLTLSPSRINGCQLRLFIR